MKKFGWVGFVVLSTIIMGAGLVKADCFSPSARAVIDDLAVHANMSNSSLQMLFDMACEDNNYYNKAATDSMFNTTLAQTQAMYNSTMQQINSTINDTAFRATANYSDWLANQTQKIMDYSGLYSNMTSMAHDMVVVANQTTVYNALVNAMDNLSSYQATQLVNFKADMTNNLGGYSRLSDIQALNLSVQQAQSNVDYKLGQMQNTLNLIFYALAGIGILAFVMPYLWKSGKLSRGRDAKADEMQRALAKLGYTPSDETVNVNQLTVPKGEDGKWSRHEIMKDEARSMQAGANDQIRKAARYAIGMGRRQQERKEETAKEMRRYKPGKREE